MVVPSNAGSLVPTMNVLIGSVDERIVLAIKHEGLAALHLFSNESYQFDHARNPAWCLDVGTYPLRVTVHYERGRVCRDFELRNTGAGLDDVRLQYWQNAQPTE